MKKLFLLFFVLFLSQNLTAKTNIPTLINIHNNYSKQTNTRINAWKELINKNQKKSIYQKLVAVNDFFNQIPYKKDIENWGKKDYWAKPLEFLVVGAGDCEDYVIAKAYTLELLGIKKDKLDYVYSDLKIKNKVQRHLVLSYFIKKNNSSIILDNVYKKLALAKHRKDLIILKKFKPKDRKQ